MVVGFHKNVYQFNESESEPEICIVLTGSTDVEISLLIESEDIAQQGLTESHVVCSLYIVQRGELTYKNTLTHFFYA